MSSVLIGWFVHNEVDATSHAADSYFMTAKLEIAAIWTPLWNVLFTQHVLNLSNAFWYFYMAARQKFLIMPKLLRNKKNLEYIYFHAFFSKSFQCST